MIERRPRGLPVTYDEPTPEQITAAKKIAEREMSTGNWETVEEEKIVTGDQMLNEVIEEVTLDRFLDRSPKVGQSIDYPEMVRVLQKKRQMFITAEAKRKSGEKEEGEDTNG